MSRALDTAQIAILAALMRSGGQRHAAAQERRSGGIRAGKRRTGVYSGGTPSQPFGQPGRRGLKQLKKMARTPGNSVSAYKGAPSVVRKSPALGPTQSTLSNDELERAYRELTVQAELETAQRELLTQAFTQSELELLVNGDVDSNGEIVEQSAVDRGKRVHDTLMHALEDASNTSARARYANAALSEPFQTDDTERATP